MSRREFICVSNKLIPVDSIIDVELDMLESCGYVAIKYHYQSSFSTYERLTSSTKQQALDIVMRLCPEALEGKRLKTSRHQWAFHNLVAHPALQILAWARKTKLGMAIHDASIPRASEG